MLSWKGDEEGNLWLWSGKDALKLQAPVSPVLTNHKISWCAQNIDDYRNTNAEINGQMVQLTSRAKTITEAFIGMLSKQPNTKKQNSIWRRI